MAPEHPKLPMPVKRYRVPLHISLVVLALS
jgi:hypothetical protein